MLCFILPLLCTLSAAPEMPDQPVRTVTAQVSSERVISTVEKLASFGTRHTLSPVAPDRGIAAARDWLREQFEQINRETGGRMSIAYQPFRPARSGRVNVDAELTNIIVAIPSRGIDLQPTPDPAQNHDRLMSKLPSLHRVCLIAHYDSRASDVNDATTDAPGANDNASGCAAILELARVLASQPPMEHSVVFVLSAGEEQGLLGARFLVDVIKDHGEQIIGVFNLDIIGDPTGTPKPDGTIPQDRSRVRIFSEGVPRSPTPEAFALSRAGAGESDSSSRQLARYALEIAQRYDLPVKPKLVFRQDRLMRGGDHIPYNDEGFPAVRFTQMYENYARQHQNPSPDNGDLPRFVDKDYLANVTRLVGASVASLAMSPAAPLKPRVLTSELSVMTTIAWDAPAGDVAGYEILYRETTSPTWERTIDVGKVTLVTLDLNKDDGLIGVRAYNAAGFRSPAVLALPRAK